MNIRDIFITLRYKISYGSTVEWYNFWYIVLRKKRKIIPQVASIDETIRKIIDDRCSVSRFGDGEVLLTSPDKEIRFQKGDPLLAKRLTEVLQSHAAGLCRLLRIGLEALMFWSTTRAMDTVWPWRKARTRRLRSYTAPICSARLN